MLPQCKINPGVLDILQNGLPIGVIDVNKRDGIQMFQQIHIMDIFIEIIQNDSFTIGQKRIPEIRIE